MIYIIRHGQTEKNKANVLQGRSDVPLNEAGVKQAEEVRDIASPLQEIVSRLGEFLDEIKEEAAEQNILISTHAIAMKGALEYLTPQSHGSYWSKYIGNCDVYTAEVTEEGKWTIPKSIS